jgi:hypothetical protein
MASFEIPKISVPDYDFGSDFSGLGDLGLDGMFDDVTDIFDDWSAEFEEWSSEVMEWGEQMMAYGEWFEGYQAVLSKGDGNAAVQKIIDGYNAGILTKEEAIQLAKQVQQQANANGGGRINGEMRDKLKDALGVDHDYIAKGKTRGQMFFENLGQGILDFFGGL